MQGKQLLTKGEVFENEILAGTKSAKQPTKQMSEPRDHGENLIEPPPLDPSLSHRICKCNVF